MRLLEFLAMVGGLVLAGLGLRLGDIRLAVLAAVAVALIYLNFLRRIRKAHAGATSSALAIFGLPIFSYLLLRAKLYYKWRRSVTWKGRHYSTEALSPQEERRTSARPAGERWSI